MRGHALAPLIHPARIKSHRNNLVHLVFIHSEFLHYFESWWNQNCGFRLVGPGQSSPAVSDLECCDSIRIHRGKTLIRRDGLAPLGVATLESSFSSRSQSTRTYPSLPDVSFRRLQSEKQNLNLWFCVTWGLSSVPASNPKIVLGILLCYAGVWFTFFCLKSDPNW